MPDQIQLVVKSLKDFKNNLILLVPILFSFGLTIPFVILVLLQVQVLLAALIFKGANFYEGYSAGLIAYAVFFFLLDFAIYLLIAAYVTAAYYGTAADVVLRGNSSFRRLLQHGRTFLKPVLTFFIAQFVVVAAPLALLSLLVFSAFLISRTAGAVLAIFLGLLYVLFIMAFYVMTLFTAPVLASRRLGGFKVIMESFRYGKSHFEHVIITAAVSIVLGIISYIIYSIFYVPSFIARIAFEAAPGTGATAMLALASFALEMLASIVLSIGCIIIMLYVFNSYFSRNPVKNWK